MSFTTLINLKGTEQKRVWVTDDYDYVTEEGWNINDVVAVLSVTGPKGLFYQNIDFDDPDIDHSIKRGSTKAINIPLDPVTGYTEPIKGNYTVKLTAKNKSTNQEIEFMRTYQYDVTLPQIQTDIKAGPYSGKLSSRDITDYGIWASQITREHRVKYPTQLIPPVPDVVSSSDYIEITPIYTNKWVVEVTSSVLWIFPDTLQVEWEGYGSFDKCVYGACIAAMATALNTLLDIYRGELPSQVSNQESRQKRLVIINQSWHLLNQAYQQGNVEECDRLADIIQKQIEYTGMGVCGGPIVYEVIPCPPYSGGGGGGGDNLIFRNGITRTLDIVEMGGSLIKNTEISTGVYSFDIFGSSGSNAVAMGASASAGINLEHVTGSSQAKIAVKGGGLELDYIGINSRRYEIKEAGLVERADYKSTYTPRSLVAKDYVDLNNNWGSQVVQRDISLSGNGTLASPLSVTNPFPGFTTLLADYGYVEPTHSFAEITDKPTTLLGYGITDAVSAFLGLSDTPSTYTGHALKWLRVNVAASGIEFVTSTDWLPLTGGTLTGPLRIHTSNDYPLVMRQIGTGSVTGVPEGGKNMIGFEDGQGDLQGEIGITSGGNLLLKTHVATGFIEANNLVAVNTGKAPGLSRFKYGLEVNYGKGNQALNNFTVHTLNYLAIATNSANNSLSLMNNALGKIGFFNAIPSAQSTGWTVTNHVEDKTYDITETTINEMAKVLGTVITELKNKGLIGS